MSAHSQEEVLPPGDAELDESSQDTSLESNPNLDGDFVALEKARQKWSQERTSLETEETDGSLSDARLSVQNVFRMIVQKHVTGSVSREPGCNLHARLLQAVEADDVEQIESLIYGLDTRRDNLWHKDYCDPVTSSTILHIAIQKNSVKAVAFLIQKGGQTLVEKEYDVVVHGVASKRTALHLLAARGDVETAKTLLASFSVIGPKKQFLGKFTLAKPQGQRPRNLSAIHIAAWKGHTDFVRMLLKQGVDVNYLNNKKDTPFLWAVRGGFLDLVEILIDAGANVNQPNDKGSVAIHWGVRYGHVGVLRALVERGKADVNVSRTQGLTRPLVLASAMGQEPIVELLLKHGANVNVKTPTGECPLHHAAKEGHAGVVQILLDKKADVNARDESGNTPLMAALLSNQPEVVVHLVSARADITQANQEGKSVWDIASMASGSEAVLSLVRSLVGTEHVIIQREGILQRLTFPPGSCPLHACAASGDVAKVKALLAIDVHPNCADERDNTMMHIAAMHNKPRVLQAFVGQADVNARNTDGNTPLHLACMVGYGECVDVLLRNNANLDAKNKMGRTPLHVTAQMEQAPAEIMKKLVSLSIKTYHWNLLDDRDSQGNTALHLAARHGCPAEIIQELGDLNIKLQNNDGNNPIHLAILNHEEATFKALMAIFEKRGRDLDLNQKNADGRTALHLAAKWADEDVVRSLVQAGADLAMGDNTGNTVLHQLVVDSIRYNERRMDYLRVFDVLVKESHRWWCMRKRVSLPEDLEQKDDCQREAMLLLTSRLQNNSSFSVVALAAKIGATDFLTRILHLDRVYRFDLGINIEYDVTHLAPTTVPPKPVPLKDGNSKSPTLPLDPLSSKKLWKPRRSCLEYVVHLSSTRSATVVLNLPVFSLIEKSYHRTCFWAYLFPFLLHVVHMTLFSYFSLPIYLEALRNTHNSTSSTTGIKSPTHSVYPAVLFLIWPALCLIYEVYYLIRKLMSSLNGSGEETLALTNVTRGSSVSMRMRLIESVFTHVTAIAFVLSAIGWFMSYLYHFYNQEYFLALALIIGWLSTINLTRGFKTVHHFSRMLQYIFVRDITRFLFVYMCVLLAFSFAFHALFQTVPNLKSRYPNPLYTMFFVFNLMIGMGEIFDEDFDQNFENAGEGTIFARVIYVAYVILATIILLNLLIAMMNESYQAIQRRHETSWRIAAINLGLVVEKFFPWLTTAFTGPAIEARKIVVGNHTETRYFLRAKKSDILGLADEHQAEENIVLIREMTRRMDAMDSRIRLVLDMLAEMRENRGYPDQEVPPGGGSYESKTL